MQPKKWIALLLGIFASPLAFMYVGRWRWALVYLVLGVGLTIVGDFVWHSPLGAALLKLGLAAVCATQAYRLAQAYPANAARPGYSRWYGLVGTALGLALVALLIRAFAIEPYRFPAESMLPTVPLGATAVVQKWGYGHYNSFGITLLNAPVSTPLQRGDIVVFEHPQDRNHIYGKRLIGLPGDSVVYHNKQLSVNGQPTLVRSDPPFLDTTFLKYHPMFTESLSGKEYQVIQHEDRPASAPGLSTAAMRQHCNVTLAGFSCVVPPGHYFMMGDNRDNSNDSRYGGFVPEDHIVGKVIYIAK